MPSKAEQVPAAGAAAGTGGLPLVLALVVLLLLLPLLLVLVLEQALLPALVLLCDCCAVCWIVRGNAIVHFGVATASSNCCVVRLCNAV